MGLCWLACHPTIALVPLRPRSTTAPTQHLPCTGPAHQELQPWSRGKTAGGSHAPRLVLTHPAPHSGNSGPPEAHPGLSPGQSQFPNHPELSHDPAQARVSPTLLRPYLQLALLCCLQNRQVVGPAGLLGFLVLLPQGLPEH